jgi:hypothetical protein
MLVDVLLVGNTQRIVVVIYYIAIYKVLDIVVMSKVYIILLGS